MRARVPAAAFGSLAAVLAAASCGGGSPALRVEPRSATNDVPFTIEASGLPARTSASVVFSGTSTGGVAWRGRLASRTSSGGRLELRDEYLYRRMHPPSGAIGPWPEKVAVTIRAGATKVTASASRFPISSDTVVTQERPGEVGFYGDWIRPRGARRQAAILLFGGAEGALGYDDVARTLAAHGYPVLHLAYFAEPGLPQQLRRIPLEYFEHALEWLGEQPEVDPRRIVTWGWSRGGEASLILASTFPKLVRAAVGYVPSAYVVPAVGGGPAEPAWTYHGKPFRFRVVEGRWRPRVIPIWQSAGPVFVVGGYDDELWPSGAYVAQIEKELHAHRRDDVVALAYQGAGHRIAQAIPSQVPFQGDYDAPVQLGDLGALYFGGSAQADEAALEDSWPKLLRFLASVGGA